MARLSVNLNKIALLRNTRTTGVPDLMEFAQLVREAGAAGITVHPRPDERHIKTADVFLLGELMREWRPAFEYNIEGRPDQRFLDIVAEVKPEQVTLVPDAPEAVTSDAGWQLSGVEIEELKPIIAGLKSNGCRVILFVDPDPTVADRVIEAGADGIEIYTGKYAAAHREGFFIEELEACKATAEAAHALKLTVNAGHDLNLKNLPPFAEAIPFLHETSIGHELTADALKMGFIPAITAYIAALGVDLKQVADQAFAPKS